MFETVAPETFETRSKRLQYETLPLSIALHALGIGAALVIAVWSVTFPSQSPRIVRAYTLASLPDPPPPPPVAAAAPAAKRVALPKLPTPPLDKVVAPTVIPDTVPQLPDPAPIALPPAPAPQPTGIPGGSVNGELGGELGGNGIAFPEDGRVHIERSKPLPLAVVSQDYPIYPEEARKKQLEDQVIVRYIIGKNGRVIDVQIINHAREPMFDEATVKAISQWRFRPTIKDGEPIEVVHELAVNFVLIRH